MVNNLIGLLLTIAIVAIPAIYLNKIFVKVIRPRESPIRLLYYFIICLLAGLAWAVLFFMIYRIFAR